MRIPVRARAAAVAVAVGGLLVTSFAMPASAALTPSVACGKLSATTVKGKTTTQITQCTPAALKAGGVSVIAKTPPVGSKKGQLGLVITWNGGKGKTTMAAGFTVQKTPGNCPAGATRITSAGSVKSSTGAAKAIIKVGEPVTATVCSFLSGPKSGQNALAPGTKYKL